MKTRALAAGLTVLQPDRLKDPAFLRSLGALGAEIGVVAAYGRILTDEVLASPRRGLINVHASLLPRYRGAAPVHRAVINGDEATGVTIMRVVKALDAGPILSTAGRPIGSDETSEDVERDLARLGAGLLVDTLDAIADGIVTETPQDEAAATYAPRLTRLDGSIDWRQSAERIRNLIRGLHPWPHAFAALRGRRVILLRAATTNSEASADPGTVLEASGDCLIVAAGHGAVRILALQLEGKRPMSARDFLAGHPVQPGERFTPAT